jgi:hypothetical protein
MLPYAEIVIGAPDGDVASYPMMEGAGKAAGAPLDVGEDPVALLRTLLPFRNAMRLAVALEP